MASSQSDLVIREVVPGTIVTFSKPFKRNGLIPIGGRSTAIKLSDGSVWVLASTPLDDETKSRLDALGPVQHIAIVDIEHTMYSKEYATAYPQARIVGPRGSRSKTGIDHVVELNPTSSSSASSASSSSSVSSDDILGTTGSISTDMKAEFFSGFINKDIAFYHEPTKTLIQGDLLFNLPAREQYSKSTQSPTVWGISHLFDMRPGSKMHKWLVYNASAKNRVLMARSTSRVMSWNFDRIIPCHGDVIETGGKKAWEDTYQYYIDDMKAGKLPTHDS